MGERMTDDSKKKLSSTIPSVGWEVGKRSAPQRQISFQPSPTGSLAPAPITPLRGGSSGTFRRPIETIADWSKWEYMLTAKVWQAVALSMDKEPDSLPIDWRPVTGGPFDDCSLEFRRQLSIAENHCGRALKCEVYTSKRFGSEVSLEAFADWALSLHWVLPSKFPGVAKAALSKWKAMELWSERELQHLCCGLVPEAGLPATSEINNAAEAIRRAVLIRSLDAQVPSGLVEADHFYGHARFFKPAKATAWAAAAFPRFPFKPEDFPPATPEPFHVEEVSKQDAGAWPWGAYETNLLRQLGDAARHWWVNYDPSDKTTAPTNQQVSDWLHAREVGKAMADKMATILRADGLPTGPRT